MKGTLEHLRRWSKSLKRQTTVLLVLLSAPTNAVAAQVDLGFCCGPCVEPDRSFS
jgi:hypothetical protein